MKIGDTSILPKRKKKDRYAVQKPKTISALRPVDLAVCVTYPYIKLSTIDANKVRIYCYDKNTRELSLLMVVNNQYLRWRNVSQQAFDDVVFQHYPGWNDPDEPEKFELKTKTTDEARAELAKLLEQYK